MLDFIGNWLRRSKIRPEFDAASITANINSHLSLEF